MAFTRVSREESPLELPRDIVLASMAIGRLCPLFHKLRRSRARLTPPEASPAILPKFPDAYRSSRSTRSTVRFASPMA